MHGDANAGDDSGEVQAADSEKQEDDASSALPAGTGAPLAVVWAAADDERVAAARY